MKKYSKSTLERMTKKELIDLYECAAHNQEVFREMYEKQTDRLILLNQVYNGEAFFYIACEEGNEEILKLMESKNNEITKIGVETK